MIQAIQIEFTEYCIWELVFNDYENINNSNTRETDKIFQNRLHGCFLTFTYITFQGFRRDLYSRCRSKFMLPEGLACHSSFALTDRVGNVNSQ